VAWLGVEPCVATGWEREQADRLGLHVTTRRPREIRGCERYRSENSTPPDAPATLTPFPRFAGSIARILAGTTH
jgi:hypothetical protein